MIQKKKEGERERENNRNPAGGGGGGGGQIMLCDFVSTKSDNVKYVFGKWQLGLLGRGK